MRFWLVVFALLVAPAAAMASEQGLDQAKDAAQVQLSTPRVFAIPAKTKDGYTAMLTVRVFDKGIADRLQRYLEDRPEYGFSRCADCFSGDGGWSDVEITDSVSKFVDIACATIGGAVVYSGAANVFIDAAGALCASFTLVTTLEGVGNQVYDNYMRETADRHAAYSFSFLGTCGFGPIC